MTFTVGGVDVAKVFVGSTPAVAVYLGAEKVWPTAPAVPQWAWHDNSNAPHPGQWAWYVRGGRFLVHLVDNNGIDQEALLRALPGQTVTLDAGALGSYTFTVTTVADDTRPSTVRVDGADAASVAALTWPRDTVITVTTA